jgi:hypothetical protein
MSISAKFTQDNYLRPDEIDARNISRLLKVIDDWEFGKYPNIYCALHDIFEITFIVNPLHYHDKKLADIATAPDWAKPYMEKEIKNFSPYIKAEFLSDFQGPAVKSALSQFKATVEESGEMSSFAIAASIFEALSIDGDGGHSATEIVKEEEETKGKYWGNFYFEWVAKYPNPFHRHIADLRVREAAFKKIKPQKFILGTLDPEPESDWKKRLEPHVAELKKWCEEQGITAPIIGNIITHATGSAPFRPHVFNYNFIRECPEKDDIFAREKERPSAYEEDRFFDFETEEFFPLHQFHKEWCYPSPIVFVTTYDVRFFPTKPDAETKLRDLIEKAIGILEEIPQRFGNPVGTVSTADAYQRPKWVLHQDGGIMIEDRIDLDDLYNLYYLLEDVIVPSAHIARTLNGARLVEARSTIKTFDQLGYGTSYSLENSPKIEQLCVVPENHQAPLEQSLKSIFTLYTIGRIDESGLVQQAMSLADMTLQGLITNQSQTLLTYEGIRAQADAAGTEIAPYDKALTDLTTAFVKAMCGVAPNVPVTSVGNLVFQTAANQRADIVSNLQGADKDDWDQRDARFDALVARTDKKSLEMNDLIAEHNKDLAISDALSGYNPDHYQQEGNKYDRAVVIPNRLVVRDPEIETCISTTFDGTPYTSRMSGHPFPRLELPKRLEPFLDPEHTPAAQQALLSFRLK